MSIKSAFIAMAANDKGEAIRQLEEIQSSLETLEKIASPTQKVHLTPIAMDVDDAIFAILQRRETNGKSNEEINPTSEQ